MSQHLCHDLDKLKRSLLIIGSMVEDAINRAILALTSRRPELAEEVIRGDEEIDTKEVELEEDCLKILALYQPVATDLRFIIAALKVNNDLERMGDLAVNIAERATYLSGRDAIEVPLTIEHMAGRVQEMVENSLESLVDMNTKLAREVLESDDEVDSMNRKMFDALEQVIRHDPGSTKRATHLLSVSRNLERIADLATNIAEDVVFMVEGELIRHCHGGGEKGRAE